MEVVGQQGGSNLTIVVKKYSSIAGVAVHFLDMERI